MRVEYHNIRCATSVWDGCRNRLSGNLTRKLGCACSGDIYTEEAIQSVESKVGERGLEGRIGAHVAELVAESTVVENAEPSPDGCLAVFPRIPGEADPRLDVFVIRLVELVP